MNIRNFVSNDHIMSVNEIAQTQSMAIQAYMLENEQLQRELKEVYDRLTNKDKQITQLTNNWNELEKDINNRLMITRRFDDYNEGYFDATLHYYNKMKEIKERNND